MWHIGAVVILSSIMILGILVISDHFAYAASAPVVKLVDSSSHPSTIPTGTVNEDWQLPDVISFCKAGPPESVYSMCPIIEWDGFTYWPYGYRDNRVGMMIVKYDDSGNVVDHWEKEGARYVDKSTVSETDKTVIFGGEYGTIVMSWDELGIDSDGGTTPPKPEPEQTKSTGGCLIATAIYGTELAPQVQQLRELRDDILLQTSSGSAFMTGFNEIYYSFSPTVADWERQYPAFKELVKATITPMLSTLSILNYVDVDSEQEVLGYGIGVILLNLGIYFIVPAILILKIRSKFS
jgi:hypothetical protein